MPRTSARFAAAEVQGDPQPNPGDGIEPGRRLIRVEPDGGQSLAERIANRLHRLTWRTPLHSARLRGRYPLKLLAVPRDPVAGDAEAGRRILEGYVRLGREEVDLATLDFAALSVSPALADHLHGFAWLRDLAGVAERKLGAEIAEFVVRRWLDVHGTQVTEPAWRPDLAARRVLFWAAYAPLILSSPDLVYRSAVLNGIARAARHLDRSADKAAVGLPRLTAWAGVIAAGLLVPGGETRLLHGEAGLARALGSALFSDGGSVSRSPVTQLAIIELLAQLAATYDTVNHTLPAVLGDALVRGVPALLGVTLGDGGLSSWQGGRPLTSARVQAAIAASGIRTRPLRQARDWGYQRMSAQGTVLVIDAAPPPVTRLSAGGSASTLAFELSDGAHRLVVNCGGSDPLLPAELAAGLRTTAAHSTLVLADTNSTAIHADGTLGRGVAEIELDRQEQEGSSRLEASHDGYVRRFGLRHQRTLVLTADGRELRGEDLLLPAGRLRRTASDAAVAVRFHLHPAVEAVPTADTQGALLRVPGGPAWHFRCRGGALAIEDSLWIDGAGVPRAGRQLIVSAETPPGGASFGWLFKRAS